MLVDGGVYFSMVYEKQSVSSCLIQSPRSEPGPSVVCASGGGEVVTKPLLGNYPISRLENRLISTRPRPAQHPALFTDPATQHGEMTGDDMPSVSSASSAPLPSPRPPPECLLTFNQGPSHPAHSGHYGHHPEVVNFGINTVMSTQYLEEVLSTSFS